MDKKNMFGLMAAMFVASEGVKFSNYDNPESEEERAERLSKAECDRKKGDGMKQFFYGENSVWAINQKNADKKAKKNKWL
jgi:hypothetical protein